ncbi:MAG: hypothetical protein JW929_04385 [Anaerolineales bacterium]|nr:hypothetical protein [Anaerolineales bacterium]
MIALSSNLESVTLWKEAPDFQVEKIIEQEMYLRSSAFSWDRERFAAGDHSGNITIWELASGSVVKTIGGMGFWVDSLAFSPDGKHLAVAYDVCLYEAPGGDDVITKRIQIMDLATGGLRTLLDADISSIEEIAYSPDGKLLAAQINQDYILFSVQTGKILVGFPAYEDGWLSNIQFSPDGRLLATSPRAWSGEDGHKPMIQLWDVDPALEAGRLIAEGDKFTEVVFSPDGKLIASGVHSGAVILWGVSFIRR